MRRKEKGEEINGDFIINPFFPFAAEYVLSDFNVLYLKIL
jgi:hypothetical protein